MRQYTIADLERIVSVQLENLNAMHDLLSSFCFAEGLALRSGQNKMR
jgi:hypothetical protein